MKKLSLLLGVCLVALTAFVAPNPSKQEKFENFITGLTELDFPFQIGIEDMTSRYDVYECLSNEELETKYRQMGEFRDFLPETKNRFSRLGPPLVEPIAKMQVADKIIGVVYSTFRQGRYRGENAFLVMFFDDRGKPIDHGMTTNEKERRSQWFPAKRPDVMGYALAFHGLENTQTVTLKEDGRISLELFENLWTKDIDEHGLLDNEITGYKPVSTEEFFITSQGKIKTIKAKELVKTASASFR